jgi:hypothetical protein
MLVDPEKSTEMKEYLILHVYRLLNMSIQLNYVIIDNMRIKFYLLFLASYDMECSHKATFIELKF